MLIRFPIIIERELAEVVGLNGAVILQRLDFLISSRAYSKEYEGVGWIQKDFVSWQKSYFTFWSISTLGRHYKKLVEKGYIQERKHLFSDKDETTWITIEYRFMGMSAIEKKSTHPKPQMPLFSEREQPKPQKQKTEITIMNEVLFRVTGTDSRIAGYQRFMKFAKKLLDAGYTANQINQWYGKGGWWYSDYWKGQRGMPPNQTDITNTITQAAEKASANLLDYQL